MRFMARWLLCSCLPPPPNFTSAPFGSGRPLRLEGGDHMVHVPIVEIVQRIKGEYLEMPGLRLTPAQAQRLWDLDEPACDAVLGVLVDLKFLARTRDGAFVRSGSPPR